MRRGHHAVQLDEGLDQLVLLGATRRLPGSDAIYMVYEQAVGPVDFRVACCVSGGPFEQRHEFAFGMMLCQSQIG